MALAFYYLSGSPFSWKVWLSLERKAIDYDLRILSADAGDLKNPAFLAVNPRGRVPAIVDRGFALHESSAIVEYLEDEFPNSGAPLWPADPMARAKARRAAIEGDAFLYPHVRKLVVELIMRKDGTADEVAVEQALTSVANELERLDHVAIGDFLAGREPSAADFALYPFHAILDRVSRSAPQRRIDEIVPKGLRRWMARIEALPYFASTLPPHWKNS